MGCCLSREDDRFHGETEALLPKGRNSNKHIEKSGDVNLAKKNPSTNGSFKSPSAVLAARGATFKVSAKPQVPKKAAESVKLIKVDDTLPTLQDEIVKTVMPAHKSTSNVKPAQASSQPAAVSLLPNSLLKNPLNSEDENSLALGCASVSDKLKDVSKNETGDEKHLSESSNGKDNDDKANGKLKRQNPQKITSTKKSKKKRKKGKK